MRERHVRIVRDGESVREDKERECGVRKRDRDEVRTAEWQKECKSQRE